LSKPDKDGITLRQHLEKVEEQLGRTPEALVGPEFPELLSHLWLSFVDISNRRSERKPLTYTEVKDFMQTMGEPLLPREVETIIKLDQLWLKVMDRDE